jgi:hypothetical protein
MRNQSTEIHIERKDKSDRAPMRNHGLRNRSAFS